ncbi:hypothetical protein LJB42_000949 [Komagataella kurtzmanii]|nr:hypothetical protein LJB42_000949 [Komagataella kurtzmanii]
MPGERVLLTGASGFIAQHITDVLLSKGYRVLGTTRRQEQADQLTQQFTAEYPKIAEDKSLLQFHLVPDIGTDNAFDEVLKQNPDIDFVLHTASPFYFGDDRPLKEVYLHPAVGGTENILNAIQKYASGSIKKVVVTSSFASVVNVDKFKNKRFIHNEDTWNPLTWEQAEVEGETSAYRASKKYAELAAWDFVKKESPKFSLTTILPPFVFGPQKFSSSAAKGTLNTSAEIVNKFLSTEYPSADKFFDAPTHLSVDVRDVALYHVLPLEIDALTNKRLFTVQSKFSGQRILNILNENFPELKGKIAVGQPEKTAQNEAANGPEYNNSLTVALGGVEFRSLETTIIDSVKQILESAK